jgi:hypothetical protein
MTRFTPNCAFTAYWFPAERLRRSLVQDEPLKAT